VSRIRVTISTDGLTAEASAEAGDACTREQVQMAITGAGVAAGVDADAVARFVEAVAGSTAVAPAVIARGRTAEPGVDGRMMYRFAFAPIVGRPAPGGRIDFHERELLHPVVEGEIVGTVVDPTTGVAGFDVRGRTLLAKPGKPHGTRLGAGVQLDGHHVLATRNGVVVQNARTLDVVDLWQHSGDVDLKSGNLHTRGSLAVQGDVRDGFGVDAGGDIVVGGAVQHATVVAGASVRIGAGALEGSHVRAGGGITARHATSSRLDAGLDVQLADEATHSFLRGETIGIVSGRGTAFGGELRARTAIALLAAGTANGAPTLLAVADVVDEQAELVRSTNQDSKANRNFGRPARDGDGPSGKSARTALKSDDRARNERLRIVQRQRALLREATITVTGTVHAGVRIRFGDATLVVDTPRTHVRFRWDATDNRIVEESLP